MKKLIVGDLHISETSISEIENIFEKDIFSVVADSFIQLGDWFDKNSPSPMEQKFSSELAKKLKTHYKEVIILSGTGEHDILHNVSAVEHLTTWGIDTVKDDLIYNNILYGHFSTNESKFNFGKFKHTITELKKYDYCFLGHEHLPQNLAKNIFHVGSIRFTSFNEVGKNKRIALLEENKLSWRELTATIPMVSVTDISQLETLEPKCKVRLVYSDFNIYKKQAAEANRIGKRFTQFKIMLDFPVAPNRAVIDHSTINKDELIINYIKGIKDPEVRKLIEDNI